MPESEVNELQKQMVRIETVLGQLVQGLADMRTQMASYYAGGHRDTPLHCEQIRRAELDIAELRREIDSAKDRDRALTTKIAVIATAISVGGGTAVNLVLKAIM